MKRFLWPLLALTFATPLVFAGASFQGLDKVGNYVVAHFSGGDVQLPNAKGAVDGSSAPTGYVGEQVVLLNDTSLRSCGNSQSPTYNDCTSLTFTVQPGRWMLIAKGDLQVDNVTGGTAGDGIAGSVAIRQGSTVVAETVTCTANLNLARCFGSAPVIAFVSLSTATSYKFSSLLRTISGAVSVSGSDIRGDFIPTTVTAIRQP